MLVVDTMVPIGLKESLVICLVLPVIHASYLVLSFATTRGS